MSGLISSISNICRALLPDSVVKWLRGDGNSVRQRFIYTPLEQWRLKRHLSSGGTYVQWYATRLDEYAKDARITSLEGTTEAEKRRLDYLESGYHDLDVLREMGVQPHNTLHEIGVGHGRSAHHFIAYLDADCYSGNDISAERLRIAQEHFSLRGLDEKRPRIIVNPDNTFDWLEGRKVDFLWANSVFGHMPPEDVEDIISNLHKVMREDSIFYFTVRGRNPERDPDRLSVKDWVRNHDFWVELGKRQNCLIELADKTLPEDFVPYDTRLMRLTLSKH
jgi:SAM-dependent methyltransferase